MTTRPRLADPDALGLTVLERTRTVLNVAFLAGEPDFVGLASPTLNCTINVASCSASSD